MNNSDPQLQPAAVSIMDAAVYLGVSSDTVRRLVRSGLLPHARIGNSIRVRRIDLDAYLEAQTSRQWQPVDGRGRRTKPSSSTPACR
ncbi:MAG: helix-turn-helix domain-containing protein [Pirellulales bacterium]|nr:helix-turn-helix domain-containing protein [Pirellulales bacterium]